MDEWDTGEKDSKRDSESKKSVKLHRNDIKKKPKTIYYKITDGCIRLSLA